MAARPVVAEEQLPPPPPPLAAGQGAQGAAEAPPASGSASRGPAPPPRPLPASPQGQAAAPPLPARPVVIEPKRAPPPVPTRPQHLSSPVAGAGAGAGGAGAGGPGGATPIPAPVTAPAPSSTSSSTTPSTTPSSTTPLTTSAPLAARAPAGPGSGSDSEGEDDRERVAESRLDNRNLIDRMDVGVRRVGRASVTAEDIPKSSAASQAASPAKKPPQLPARPGPPAAPGRGSTADALDLPGVPQTQAVRRAAPVPPPRSAASAAFLERLNESLGHGPTASPSGGGGGGGGSSSSGALHSTQSLPDRSVDPTVARRPGVRRNEDLNLLPTMSLPVPGGGARAVSPSSLFEPPSGSAAGGAPRVSLHITVPTDPTEAIWTTPAGLSLAKKPPHFVAGRLGQNVEHRASKKEVRSLLLVGDQVWCGGASEIKVYEHDAHKCRAEIALKSRVLGLAWSPSEVAAGGTVWAGLADGRAVLISPEGQPRVLLAFQLHRSPVVGFALLSPPAHLAKAGAAECGPMMMAVHEDGVVMTLRLRASPTEPAVPTGPRHLACPVTAVLPLPDCGEVWCGSARSVDVYTLAGCLELETPPVVRTVAVGALGPVSSMARAGPANVVSSHGCGMLGLWSAASHDTALVKILDLYGVTITHIAPCLRDMVWCGALDGRLFVFDAASCKFIKAFSAHNSCVTAVAAAAPGAGPATIVASGSREGTVRLWRGDLKEEWVERELEKREDAYTSVEKVRVFVGTWNVNAQLPVEDLAKWLAPDGPGSAMPDVYALGLQEAVQLNASNAMSVSEATLLSWEHLFSTALQNVFCRGSRSQEYVPYCRRQLVGLVLIIFVRIERVKHLRDVQVDSVKAGFGGLAGNKGGIAVSLFLGNTVVAFVCCHLAAGQKHTDQRNQDQRSVLTNAKFAGKGRAVGSNLGEHDVVFFFGDLNYRINLPYEECKAVIFEKNWARLHEADQLLLTMAAPNDTYWRGFREPWPPNFAPTYKYDVGTNIYDTGPKQRSPAWCDRILYRGRGVTPLTYARHELLQSDHRPVSATFDMEMRILDQVAKRALQQTTEAQWTGTWG